jgi:D-beta-D-heptose 7-phosphate kinase/D-beta-D-heptose 1-phosphate adenosyltransferase
MKQNSKTPNILVVGDLMIDEYLWGECDRISPEAPVQIVDIKNEELRLGGAGNVLSNLIEFGANCFVSTVLGDDKSGKDILAMLKKINVSTDNTIIENGRLSGKKTRIISRNQQIVRYDKESKENISKKSQELILKQISQNIEQYDIIILSDYAKGVLVDTLTKDIISLANRNNKKVIADPKGDDFSKYKHSFAITPNKKEASIALKINIDDKNLESAIKQFKTNFAISCPIITLSEKGISYYLDNFKRVSTKAKEVYDVTGAGDTIIAGIGFGLASGLDIDESIHFANYAAAVVVGKTGSATASIQEIEAYKSSIHKSNSDVHIKDIQEIIALKSSLLNNKKIIFTNGCFDILHLGHVKYLEKAKSFGDTLIVGLNSDNSVRRLKGESRPIKDEYDRAYILASLEVVDYVVLFDEDTPYNLIKAIKPDILVKGGDYQNKSIVGSDIAKEVRLVEFVDGKSTTTIINKILNR